MRILDIPRLILLRPRKIRFSGRHLAGCDFFFFFDADGFRFIFGDRVGVSFAMRGGVVGGHSCLIGWCVFL